MKESLGKEKDVQDTACTARKYKKKKSIVDENTTSGREFKSAEILTPD